MQLEPLSEGELFSIEVKQGTETLVANAKFLLPTNRRQHKACELLVAEAEAAREAAAAKATAAAELAEKEAAAAEEASARKRQRI